MFAAVKSNKQSGYGREHGPEAMNGYPQTKSVFVPLDG